MCAGGVDQPKTLGGCGWQSPFEAALQMERNVINALIWFGRWTLTPLSLTRWPVSQLPLTHRLALAGRP